LSPHSYRTKSG